MKYKGLFHLHHHIIPFRDKENKKLLKNINKHLLFFENNGIKIVDFTWHSHHFCKKISLMDEDINFLKLNLIPLEIFKILKREAGKKGILVIPSLEVSVETQAKGRKEIFHMLVMHENEETLYNNGLSHCGYSSIEDLFEKIPKDSLIIIPHPWRFGFGLTYHLGVDATNKLAKKCHALLEINGWVYPWNYLMDAFSKAFPFLSRLSRFRNFHKLAKKNIELSGLKKGKIFYGSDSHADHLLPGNSGYVELDIVGKPTPKKVIDILRKEKINFVYPKEKDFFKNLWWVIYDLYISFIDEAVLEFMIWVKSFNK